MRGEGSPLWESRRPEERRPEPRSPDARSDFGEPPTRDVFASSTAKDGCIVRESRRAADRRPEVRSPEARSDFGEPLTRDVLASSPIGWPVWKLHTRSPLREEFERTDCGLVSRRAPSGLEEGLEPVKMSLSARFFTSRGGVFCFFKGFGNLDVEMILEDPSGFAFFSAHASFWTDVGSGTTTARLAFARTRLL